MNHAWEDARLKRKELWLSLWLARVFAMLFWFGQNASPARRAWLAQTLRRLAGHVMALIVYLAVRRLRDAACERPAWKDPRAPSFYPVGMRQAFGAALRKSLRAPTLHGKFERLARVFLARAAYVKRWLKFHGRGRTRLVFAHTRAAIGADARVVAGPRLLVASADTS